MTAPSIETRQDLDASRDTATRFKAAARELRACGFGIVWLREGEKRPQREGWTLKSQEPDDYRAGSNLGLLTGRLSRDLVNVDLDSPEALAAADEFLPPTEMIDGRPGKPRSHRWYIVSDIPQELTSSTGAAGGVGGPWLKHFPGIDFLGTGGQAVVPPSKHQSGERRIWYAKGEPAEVPMAELWDAVTRLAQHCGWEPPAPPLVNGSANGRHHAAKGGPAVDRARRYLAKMPGAVSGQSGHDRTFHAACVLTHGFGLSAADAYPLLAEWNTTCDPPWSSKDLRHKLDDAARREGPRGYLLDVEPPPTRSSEPSGTRDGINLTDLGNARRLVKLHGHDLRYCHPWRKWLVWDSRRWKVDDSAEVERRAKGTIAAMYAEAITLEGKARRKLLQHAMETERRSARIAAMISLARSEPGIAILPSDLDKDPWLLNVMNGTIELKTGTLREHRREDRITKLCPVECDARAGAPLWEKFLTRILEGNSDLVGFLQRAVGYSLTGSTAEQVLFFIHGSGANGKSTFLETVQRLLGPDFAMQAPSEMLMARQGDHHPTELSDLFGRRFIACIETDDNKRLAESLVKQMTGCDRIRARRMREDFWEFVPTHKLWLAANHKPTIRGTDFAIWRRILLVPFTAQIPDDEKDTHLAENLAAEHKGILAWAVHGCLDWQRHGLGVPDEVRQATAQYRADEDVLGSFFSERCSLNRELRIKASDLYAGYVKWAEAGKEFALSQRKFCAAVMEKGVEKYQNNGTWYRGVALTSE